MVGALASLDVDLVTFLLLVIPATLLGVLAGTLSIAWRGKKLSEDPVFQEKVKSGNGAKVDGLDLFTVMRKRLAIVGSTMRPRTTAEKGESAKALRETVWPVLDAGRCAPVIHKVFPLAEAAAAHRLMENSAHIGKIMLKVAD